MNKRCDRHCHKLAGASPAIAEGFGLKALKIETPLELEDGITEAFGAKGPFFFDVKSEQEADHLPPVYSWRKIAGTDTSGFN